MSYSDSAYWQAKANACTQYADEGACLARVSRHVPVTIVPGLGQVEEIVTLPARNPQIAALQTALMNAGALTIRTADGLISGDSSPTLTAIRAWASARGMSPAGVARVGSGLAIPSTLLASILSGAATANSAPGKGAPAAAPPSAVLPDFAPTSTMPSWAPWAAGLVGLAVVGTAVAVVRR